MGKILFMIIALTSVNLLFSYQWPTNKDYLKSLFGTVNEGTVQDGIKFYGVGQAIYPLADGEIIYYQDSFVFGDLDYTGDEGNILVLRHLGEFKSIYRNFSTTDSYELSKDLKKTEMVGISDNSSDDFIFSIYDDKRQAYINPQQILPFLLDDRKPVIRGVFLENEGNEYKLARNKILPSGSSTLTINAWDIVTVKGRYMKFIPFRVNVFVDGFERYNASFSSIKEIDGEMFLSGESDIPMDKILSVGDMLFGGDIYLTNGRSLIEVVVRDIDGNETSKSYSVIVD